MKGQNLRDLRKSKKISQNELAEKLFVSVATIRKWENDEALPSVQDMFSMAEVLEIQVDDIKKIFKKEQTLVEKDNLEEKKAYEAQLYLFWDTDNINKFIKLFYAFSYIKDINGAVYSEKCLFPYSKIIANPNGDGVVIADTYNNLIVFTTRNVKSVTPISANYDVFIFEIVLFCSVFPLEDREDASDLSNSTIKISVYSR